MKVFIPRRLRVLGLCAAFALWQWAAPATDGQAYGSVEAQLVGKARTLEARGRVDMARSVWQQVLLVDPKNTEALGALARAARQEGRTADVARYLNQLRAINPQDPNLTQAQGPKQLQNPSSSLDEAARLAHTGDPARAMEIYRQTYGATPLPGEPALAYYGTEAATDDGRPHAIAGLRALADRFPSDPRYQIALGRILTYNPRTRAEGRKLLERFPSNAEAMVALRQAMEWDAAPGSTVARRSSPESPEPRQEARAVPPSPPTHTAPPSAVPSPPTVQTPATPRVSPAPPEAEPTRQAPRAATPVAASSRAPERAISADMASAYAALKKRHFAEAEWRFRSALQRNPGDAQALSGLGSVQLAQGDVAAAAATLARAKTLGAHGPAFDRALADARFGVALQAATASLNRNDLPGAQAEFTAALQQRPGDPSALGGLGATLLKAQQHRAATKVFSDYALLRPSDPAAWRGLLIADVSGGRFAEAAKVQARIPPGPKRELVRDPEYLRAVLAIDTATGNAGDAPWVLNATLDLPFPAGGRGLKPELQLQYAALLNATGLKAQAAGLYRQVLAADAGNIDAWVGLITLQHESGQDEAAYAAIHALSPGVYAAVIMEPAFVVTESEIDRSQGRDAAARSVLEALLARQASERNAPYAPAQVALAELYVRDGQWARAYPLYRTVLLDDPQRLDAWAGLIDTLHATGHDPEALAQFGQVPVALRTQLEADPHFLQTMGLIYAAADQPEPALRDLTRVEQHYAVTRRAAPVELDIELARVLYRLRREPELYRQLLVLGGRSDLNDAERLTVQTIWADWAVRKAEADAAAGVPLRSVAVLDAGAQAFPNNPTMVRAVRESYGPNGIATRVLPTLRAQGMAGASAGDLRAAITAALVTHNLRDAETWIHLALARYPQDAQVLVLTGKYEVARGRGKRALEYFRASLAVPPPPDPGTQLVRELGQPSAQLAPAPSNGEREALISLLAQPGASLPLETTASLGRPYLPSYAGQGAQAAQVDGAAPQHPGQPHATAAPRPAMYGLSTPPAAAGALPGTSGAGDRLRDYLPQSRIEIPARAGQPVRNGGAGKPSSAGA